MGQTEGWVTLSRAAELTGHSAKALRNRADRGSLPTRLEHGRRYVSVAELVRQGLLDRVPVPEAEVDRTVSRIEDLIGDLAAAVAELRLELAERAKR